MLSEKPKRTAKRKRVVLWKSCWFDDDGIFRELIYSRKTNAYIWMCCMLRQKCCAWIVKNETEHWYVDEA